MKKVGTATLKNNLSKYLHKVQKGSRFVVTDHDKPVAKLIPIDEGKPQSIDEKLAQLSAEGYITYNPSTKRSKGKKPRFKAIALGMDLASQYVISDRE